MADTCVTIGGGPDAPPAPPEPELARVVEALLFSSEEPLSLDRLCSVIEGEERGRVRETLRELEEECRLPGRSYFLEEVGGGWRLTTKPEFAPWIRRLCRARREERLSAAALEILAVVAYRQPIIKAEIDALRGVQSDGALRGLLDRRLVRVVGRAEVLGRPLQYGTTKEFLEKFGLPSLKDLPRPEEFRARAVGALGEAAPAPAFEEPERPPSTGGGSEAPPAEGR